MGLETRHGTHAYYYRKVRRGRRVTSEYVGGGEFASAVAAIEALDRDAHDLERAKWDADRAGIEQHDELVAQMGQMVHELVVSTLEASGFHRHRGQWRKRRGQH